MKQSAFTWVFLSAAAWSLPVMSVVNFPLGTYVYAGSAMNYKHELLLHRRHRLSHAAIRSLSSDRVRALKTFINGLDTYKDGRVEVPGVADIRIGIKSYARQGNWWCSGTEGLQS